MSALCSNVISLFLYSHLFVCRGQLSVKWTVSVFVVLTGGKERSASVSHQLCSSSFDASLKVQGRTSYCRLIKITGDVSVCLHMVCIDGAAAAGTLINLVCCVAIIVISKWRWWQAGALLSCLHQHPPPAPVLSCADRLWNFLNWGHIYTLLDIYENVFHKYLHSHQILFKNFTLTQTWIKRPWRAAISMEPTV